MSDSGLGVARFLTEVGRGACFTACMLAAGCATSRLDPSPGRIEDSRGLRSPPIRRMSVAIDRGADWLLTQQNPDGGFGPSIGVKDSSDVGITAFALYALARCPRAYKEKDGSFVVKAVEFLTRRQQASGAIFDPRDPLLRNYKTSVALLALLALDRVKYALVIQKAVAFVKSEQFSEDKGYVPSEHLSFGGIGTGTDPGRPDLSNSQFAAEALRQAGLSGADELWARLKVFLGRCQNAETVDPVLKAAGIGTSKDGGFRYQPAGTRGNTASGAGGETCYTSYGSMTYAGLKSMLHASVARDDPRVQTAFQWIQRNFSVKENPGLATPVDPAKGQQGLFYYYHTMAKALAAYGQPVVMDQRGAKRLWARELGDQIASLQRAQGSWRNPVERWLEGIEVLDTSYSIVALTISREELERYLSSPEGQAEPRWKD